MHQYYFYVSPDQIINSNAILTGDEFHHCTQVLRKKPGDQITLINGTGDEFTAELQSISRDQCSCHILSFAKKNRLVSTDICLAFGLVKNKALEQIIRSVTAMGVSRILPLQMEHSVKEGLNIERLYKIAIESIKQSGNYYLPKIEPLQNFKDFIKSENPASLNFIAEQDVTGTMHDFIRKVANIDSIILLIGPEGGFHYDEFKMAEDAGFKPVNIHPYRLRTELAAIVAVANIQALIK